MIRLSVLLILTGMFLLPVVAAEEGQNSTEGYTVREYALISFEDPINPDEQAVNNSSVQGDVKSENQTRRGSELSARKLFQLEQAAEGDYQILRNQSGDPTLGLSSTAAQSVSIMCKQCVPQKTGYY